MTQSFANRMQFESSPFAAARAIPVTLMLSTVIVISHFLSGGHDAQRILQLGFLGVVSAWIIAVGRFAFLAQFFSRRADWPLALFFALGAVSSVVSDSPMHAIREVLMLVLLFVIAICVAEELHSNYTERLTIILYVVGAGAALYLFKIGVVWATALLTHLPPDHFAFAPGFSNYRFFNHAQTVSLPLLVLAACRCNPSARRRWLILASLWACLLVVLSARGSVMGLFAGCAVAIAVQRRQALYFCKTFVLVGLGGVSLYFILFNRIPVAAGMDPFGSLQDVVARSIGDDPTSFRNILWSRALDYIAAHPWLGIGPAHYGRYAFDLNNASHPHNWPLQIAAEWGIPALLCLLIVIWTAGRGLLKAFRLVDPEDTPNQLILSALIVTGIAILMDGCVSGLIVMPVSQLLIALYIGCAAGWVWSLLPRQVSEPKPLARLAMSFALFASVVGLAIGAHHDFARGSTDEMRVHPDVTYGHPRLWSDEYFNEAEMRRAAHCGHGKQPACR